MDADTFVIHAKINVQTLEAWVEAGWLVLPPEANRIADEVGRRLASASDEEGTV